MAGVDKAMVLIAGEATNVVHRLDPPMPAHEFEQPLGVGRLRVERGQGIAGFPGDLSGLKVTA